MESGLEDRNNRSAAEQASAIAAVSMESGLEDRNNPRRPGGARGCGTEVSMESGLEDRNNH